MYHLRTLRLEFREYGDGSMDRSDQSHFRVLHTRETEIFIEKNISVKNIIHQYSLKLWHPIFE